MAGEANVPFFSISGSDFVEMFVGVGASVSVTSSRRPAKVAPCIVFIDEIDTIGKSRDNRMGGNDERGADPQPAAGEMDGFDPTKGIILLAATNRPEVLDQALLRPAGLTGASPSTGPTRRAGSPRWRSTPATFVWRRM